jgi:hypothetical protein
MDHTVDWSGFSVVITLGEGFVKLPDGLIKVSDFVVSEVLEELADVVHIFGGFGFKELVALVGKVEAKDSFVVGILSSLEEAFGFEVVDDLADVLVGGAELVGDFAEAGSVEGTFVVKGRVNDAEGKELFSGEGVRAKVRIGDVFEALSK